MPGKAKLEESISLRNARCTLLRTDETRRTVVVTAANNSDRLEFQVATMRDAAAWIKRISRRISESVDPTL